MTWSAPMTAVANATFTAAQFNQYVRDNLLETGPAKATTAGRYLVTKGTNSIGEGINSEQTIATAEGTASTSFVDLATAGPAVTLTTGASAFIGITALMANNAAGGECLVSVAVSGASTVAAADARSLRYESSNANDQIRMTYRLRLLSLTPGSNTFTLKYRVTAGTGTFSARNILVEGL